LGVLYRDGRGTAKNEVEAVDWFRKSAEKDDAYGQMNLGSMYFKGRGASVNTQKRPYMNT